MLFALIEDDASIAELIGTILELRDHRLAHFFDGASFFTSLQTASYDFVLVDFNLPGAVSGLQVISFLQKNMPAVPVLVVTGVSDSFLKTLRIFYPQVPILRKPFAVRAFFQSIEEAQKSA